MKLKKMEVSAVIPESWPPGFNTRKEFTTKHLYPQEVIINILSPDIQEDKQPGNTADSLLTRVL